MRRFFIFINRIRGRSFSDTCSFENQVRSPDRRPVYTDLFGEGNYRKHCPAKSLRGSVRIEERRLVAGAVRRDIDCRNSRLPQYILIKSDDIGVKPTVLFAYEFFCTAFSGELFDRVVKILSDLIAAEMYRRADRRAYVFGLRAE